MSSSGEKARPFGLAKSSATTAILPLFRIDPVDVAAVLLHLALVALVVAHDPVVRIGEPDRAVRPHHHVVRRVEALALVAVGDHGDRAVGLGTCHAARSMLAGDQPSLAVTGVAIGII
jgi:hypothetical protein